MSDSTKGAGEKKEKEERKIWTKSRTTKKQKAHRLAYFTGGRRVAGYENPVGFAPRGTERSTSLGMRDTEPLCEFSQRCVPPAEPLCMAACGGR